MMGILRMFLNMLTFLDNSVMKAYCRASVFLTQICKAVFDIFIFNVSKKLFKVQFV